MHHARGAANAQLVAPASFFFFQHESCMMPHSSSGGRHANDEGLLLPRRIRTGGPLLVVMRSHDVRTDVFFIQAKKGGLYVRRFASAPLGRASCVVRVPTTSYVPAGFAEPAAASHADTLLLTETLLLGGQHEQHIRPDDVLHARRHRAPLVHVAVCAVPVGEHHDRARLRTQSGHGPDVERT